MPRKKTASRKTTASAAGRAIRRRRVAAMLAAGHEQCDIAAELGFSESTIAADAKLLVERYRDKAAAPVQELRSAELARIEAVATRLQADFNRSGSVRAATVLLQASAARTRLLGLDSPDAAALHADGERLKAALMSTVLRFFGDDGRRLAAFAACLRADLDGIPVERMAGFADDIAPFLADGTRRPGLPAPDRRTGSGTPAD